MGSYFNPSQVSEANGAFAQAEQLAGRYFRIGREGMKAYRYDVKTLAYLERHEVQEGAFAHLCKYDCRKADEAAAAPEGFHFYRVCLQDNRILEAVQRAGSFIRFVPLMLYIASHELVHIIRFDRGEVDFDAGRDEKAREEDKVHAITREMLQPLSLPAISRVMECFSDRYRIGDLFPET